MNASCSQQPAPVLPADLLQGYQAHRPEVQEAIQRVLESGRYILGEEVAAFEAEFARYLGAKHVVCAGSGTDALCLAMRACNIGSGDGVLTVSHTAVATVAAVELCGAQPLLVDVVPRTYTMDPARLEESVNAHRSRSEFPRLRAIIPVHLYGCPADMEAILDVARRHDLLVIEDCAQAHGATFRGRRVGTWGDLAAFSFYPTKNLGGYGDGGAIATDDGELAERLRLLREYGWKERYISLLAGTNSRLDELQAAVLRVKLRYLDGENRKRQELAGVYERCLANSGLVLPGVTDDAIHVYHQYVIRTPYRAELRELLRNHQVHTLVHYPVPVHLQPAYRGRVLTAEEGLPQTERLCHEILSLPIHPHLTPIQAERVGQLVMEFSTAHRKEP